MSVTQLLLFFVPLCLFHVDCNEHQISDPQAFENYNDPNGFIVYCPCMGRMFLPAVIL